MMDKYEQDARPYDVCSQSHNDCDHCPLNDKRHPQTYNDEKRSECVDAARKRSASRLILALEEQKPHGYVTADTGNNGVMATIRLDSPEIRAAVKPIIDICNTYGFTCSGNWPVIINLFFDGFTHDKTRDGYGE